MLKNFLLVGLGGCLGSMMRYACWILLKQQSFPAATLIVNITGSLVIGMVIGMGIKEAGFSQDWKLFLATGICGGFTTFSAFSVENLHMLQNGKYFITFLNISLSIFFGIGAAWFGFKLTSN